MELYLDNGDAENKIERYSAGEIQISGEIYKSNLLLMPNLKREWDGVVDSSAVQTWLEFKPELIILGTGDKTVFYNNDLFLPLYGQGIGVEVMDTSSACRTYTVLMSDMRQVLACLRV